MVPSEGSAVLGIVTSGLWVSVLRLENGYQDMACLVPITRTTDRFGTGLAHQRHSGCLWEPLRLGELAELPAHLAAARPAPAPGRERSLIRALQQMQVFSLLAVRPQMAAGSPARGNTFHTHAAPLCGTWRAEAGAHHPVRDAFQPGAGGEPGAQGGGLDSAHFTD